ncbi:putative ankyrin repeat domain-containing protein 31 [Python bivittatus]|uniref:Ankyrin repeat domain-containing protein 31 n=1 Tax=Python bivittatus TaxID=176946 RepID=A0A9F5IJ83_PYTBI|nr:putative ankyrin repeat domain-containing protein 31 [Python bivittatus]
MAEGGEISDADSDETMVEGSVVESDVEEKELRAKRFSLMDKDMVLARETSITARVANAYGENLSPEIPFNCINFYTQSHPGLINLSYQEITEEEESQSLLPFNYKEYESSQLGICTCHCSFSDANTKIEQVRKSQRIARKTRKQTIFNCCSNDSSCNYIPLSVINRRDTFGQTLLHRAATEDDLDGIRAMIKAGADVNVQDYAGWTPLHESSLAGCFEISNELLKAGADVNCKGYEQVTPLHDAVKDGHYKVAELLLWYGADPLFKNERGKNALEEATDKRMRKLVKSYIVQSGKTSASENLGRCHNKAKEEENSNNTSNVPFLSVKLKTFQTEYNGNCQNDHLGSSSNVKEVSSSHTKFSQTEERQIPQILDLYIQDFSQIQNSLNTILARQKSERDELAKKYRASVESFKQGVLRERLVKLAARQKNLLLMARKQKELGGKIQNYKNAKKEALQLTNQAPNTLDSYENSTTKNGTSGETVPCPNIIMGMESIWDMENSSLNQDHADRFPDTSGGNGEINSQEKDCPQLLVFESKRKEYNIAEITYSESSDATDSATLLPNSVTCSTQQSKEIDYISMTPQESQSLSAISRLQILNNSATGGDDDDDDNNICQPSIESQNICTTLPQHSRINNVFSIQPIAQLESTHSFVGIHQDNIAPSKKISVNVNLESPGTFSHVISQNRISQNSSQYSNNQDSEKQLHFKTNKKKKNQLLGLLELGKIKPGDDVLEFTLQDSKHKASLLGNGKVQTGNNSVYQTPVQWIKAILGNDIYVTYCGTPLSTIIAEVQVSKEPEFLLQQKNLLDSSCQANSSKTSSFLQFNKIMLITDEEFLPCHAGEKYWDFYTNCENFGF